MKLHPYWRHCSMTAWPACAVLEWSAKRKHTGDWCSRLYLCWPVRHTKNVLWCTRLFPSQALWPICLRTCTGFWNEQQIVLVINFGHFKSDQWLAKFKMTTIWVDFMIATNHIPLLLQFNALPTELLRLLVCMYVMVLVFSGRYIWRGDIHILYRREICGEVRFL